MLFTANRQSPGWDRAWMWPPAPGAAATSSCPTTTAAADDRPRCRPGSTRRRSSAGPRSGARRSPGNSLRPGRALAAPRGHRLRDPAQPCDPSPTSRTGVSARRSPLAAASPLQAISRTSSPRSPRCSRTGSSRTELLGDEPRLLREAPERGGPESRPAERFSHDVLLCYEKENDFGQGFADLLRARDLHVLTLDEPGSAGRPGLHPGDRRPVPPLRPCP